MTEMGHDGSASLVTPDAIFKAWLERFSTALEDRNAKALVHLFDANGYWRDILSFTWEHRTFSGIGEIANAFDATAASAGVRNVRIAAGRSVPSLVKRFGRSVVEGYFD